MTRNAILLSGLATLLAAAAAVAEDSPLAQVPDTAPVVVQLHGVERVRTNVLALLREALPGPAGRQAVAQAKDAIDDLQGGQSDGRRLAALAPDGPVFLMMTEFPADLRDASGLALVARVSDYTAFRDGLLTADERKGLEKRQGYEEAATAAAGRCFSWTARTTPWRR